MSLGSILVLASLALIAGGLTTVAIKAWRNPEMVGDRLPFARMLPFGPQTRSAVGRAMLPWAASILFICLLDVLAVLRGSHSAQSAQGRELRPYVIAAVVGCLVSILLAVAVVCFNRPRFLVPPHRRAEQGLAAARRAERRS